MNLAKVVLATVCLASAMIGLLLVCILEKRTPLWLRKLITWAHTILTVALFSVLGIDRSIVIPSLDYSTYLPLEIVTATFVGLFFIATYYKSSRERAAIE